MRQLCFRENVMGSGSADATCVLYRSLDDGLTLGAEGESPMLVKCTATGCLLPGPPSDAALKSPSSRPDNGKE